ncbi:MAG: YciI family protein, partial [Sciscionella sp.]
MQRFTVDTRYCADRDALAATRPAHREYLQGLVQRGSVLLAGPWADDTGGFAVYQVADTDELDTLLADDPYSTAGVAAERTIRE